MLTPAEELTPKQLARTMELGEVFRKRIYAVSKTALVRAERGVEIPGWKIVQGRGNRVFKEGAPVEVEFGKAAFQPAKLCSPAQIDRLPGGRAFTTRWASSPETGNKLVKSEDARPEQGPAQKSMFQPRR